MDAGELQATVDTVWLITAGALVFFMLAGFAMLEAGLVRAKNSVNVLMKTFQVMTFGSLSFWLIGFGLMFGTNPTGWFGTDRFFLASDVPWDYSFFFFQVMFAAVAASILSGALAERIRYSAYILAVVVMTAAIYPLYGGWAWGGNYAAASTGWLQKMGFADFAGSGVVHVIGGWASLAGILILGPRLGRFSKEGEPRAIPGHNLALVTLGTFILWLGWLGFNGGSGLAASQDIGRIVVNTHLSGCAGAVACLVALGLMGRPLLLTTSMNGALAGMVAVCAGADVFAPVFAILTGAVAGVLVIGAEGLLLRLRLDDAVGAVPVHGVGGLWGVLAAGLFDPKALFDPGRLGVQALGGFVGVAWGFGAGWLMFKGIDWIVGLRRSTVDEQRGLDYVEHAEICYPEFQEGALR